MRKPSNHLHLGVCVASPGWHVITQYIYICTPALFHQLVCIFTKHTQLALERAHNLHTKNPSRGRQGMCCVGKPGATVWFVCFVCGAVCE